MQHARQFRATRHLLIGVLSIIAVAVGWALLRTTRTQIHAYFAPNRYAPLFRNRRITSQSPAFPTTARSKTFTAALNTKDARITRELLVTFIETVTAAKLVYFMYCGTLLGSYRHHGMVPWDDDIDIAMDFERKADVKQELSKLAPRYALFASGMRWKFFLVDGSSVGKYSWRFPYIDIWFYRTDEKRVWDSDPGYADNFNYERDWIFPLGKRPFWGLMLAAPRKTAKVLEQEFNIGECQSNSYDHRHETRLYGAKTVPCRQLWQLFPFVFRTTLNATKEVNETLKIGQTVLSWEVLPQ